jgi:hypothetical protein
VPNLIEKRYLGDAVYAEVENRMIKLTAENGYRVTNTILLEIDTYLALVRFYEDAMAATWALSEEPHPVDCLCDSCICGGCGRRKHEGEC